MILPALISHYDRLAADEESGVAPQGYSRQKVSFIVTVRGDGAGTVSDARQSITAANDKVRLVARSVVVPGQSKPPGSGINPCMLWDNAAYLLGYKPDDPKPERTRACFEAFRDRHAALADEIDDDGFRAVVAFLKSWDPEAFAPSETVAESLASFGAFRFEAEERFVHERETVDAWYRATLENDPDARTDDDGMAFSLTTGRPARIARLHEPKIKGVWGAQSSGATLVSFNCQAFESYGKSQGENAPVAEADAFKYCTALNNLLANPDRRAQIGDATVVWWADGISPEEAFEVFGAVFGTASSSTTPDDKEDSSKAGKLKAAMSDLARGVAPAELAGNETGFHVLGLSPNAARLSVRFWWDGTVGQMINRVKQYHAEMQLGEWEEHRPISLRMVVRETAMRRGGERDDKAVPPRLSGDLYRSIVLGTPYPESLLDAILRRIRLDGDITATQARVLKACLIRRGVNMQQHLDPDYPSTAYQCGRLFGTLDFAHRVANPGSNSTLAGRYLRSAMATPGVLMGHLEARTQVHLRKLPDDAERFFNDEICEISARLSPPLPSHLLGVDQSIFMLGYYKQLKWLENNVASTRSGSISLLRRYRTIRGEWVRSRIECRVLDALHRHRVTYIYEPLRLLGDGVPRVPDLVVRGATPSNDLYIEVAGGWKDNMNAYNARHDAKLKEYTSSGISNEGGENGRLRVLDFRSHYPTNDEWDDMTYVINPLRDALPVTIHTDNSTETEEN